jgi:dTDP-4-amino-4,6-dideoxygalactose transaminase
MLRAKLPALDGENAARARIAAQYMEGLADVAVELPTVAAHAEPVWHQFVAQVDDRARVQQELSARGIGTMIHYPIACHRQPAFAGQTWPALPVSERLQDRILSLPISPVHTTGEIDEVIAALTEIVGPRRRATA